MTLIELFCNILASLSEFNVEIIFGPELFNSLGSIDVVGRTG